jgi:alpha-glucosidase
MVEVWEKFNEYDLPLDTIWSDIDYMNELVDFTIDKSRYDYKEMNRMLDR